MNGSGLALILLGLFSLSGAYFDWDWFMEHRRAQFLTRILGGRTRARTFYTVLGLTALTLGMIATIGLIDLR
jgi:hypothetical protein